MGHVFISYARIDKKLAKNIQTILEKEGYSTWLDESNLDQSQDFTGEIEYAIREASHFIVCLTEDVKNRRDSFVRREIMYALNIDKSRAKETPSRRLPIIPLVFPGGELPVSLSTWTRIDVNPENIDSVDRLLLSRLSQELGPEGAEYPLSKNVEIVENYLRRLQEFTSTKLYESVYSLLTLATSSLGIAHADPFSFAFSVSPAVRKTLPSTSKGKIFTSFEKAFDYHNGHVFLIGKPGAGKTTTLMAFVRDAAVSRLYDTMQDLPILKSIHTWRPGVKISDWLFSEFESFEGIPIQDEKFVFVLDGLDEIGDKVTAYKYTDKDGAVNYKFEKKLIRKGDKDKYEEVEINPRLYFLELLSKYMAKHKIVISIREDEFIKLKSGIQLGEVYLQSLDNEQIRNYFSSIDLGYVWEKAKIDSELLQMLRTPLVLGLFTFAILPMEGQPPLNFENLTENEIFDLFVHRRFIHEMARPRSVPFDEVETRHVLSQLSANLLIRNEISNVLFSIDDVIEILGNKTEGEAFYIFAQRMHLFMRTTSNITSFVHLKLRDFFALPGLLVKLADGNRFEREASAKLLRIIWHEIAVPNLVAAVTQDNNGYVKGEALITLLEKKSFQGIGACLHYLGNEENPTVLRILIDILNDYLLLYRESKLVSALLECAYFENRMVSNWAARILIGYSDDVLNKLISNLHDNNIDKVCKTVELVSEFKDEEAFQGIVSLLYEGDFVIRLSAIKAIVKYGKNSTKHLLKLLRKSEISGVRLASIDSLAMVCDQKASKRLSKLLIEDSLEIRKHTIKAFAQIGGGTSVEALCQFINSDLPNEYEKILTAQALENISNSIAAPCLLMCVKTSNLSVRQACASALITCQYPDIIPEILSEYERESDWEVIELLGRAIGQEQNIAYLQNMHDMLKSSKYELRKKAMIAIGYFADSSSESKLQNLKPSTKEEQSLIIKTMRKVQSN